MTTQATLPLERLYHWESTTPDRVFLRQRSSGEFVDLTWREVAARVRRAAAMLRDLVPEPGSRIAISSKNCADWFIADLAIMMAGHVSVPLYPGVAVDTMRYILEHADVKLAFFGPTDNVTDLVDATPDGIPTVGIHACPAPTDMRLASLLEEHEPLEGKPCPDPDFIFTLMYTSGTTGRPKGVMHALSTVAFAVPDYLENWSFTQETRFFSYLPLAHAAERIIVEMNSLYSGGTVAFAESLDTFADDLRAARPTIFFSVPRLYRKFKDGVETKFPPKLLRTLLRVPLIGPRLRLRILDGLGLDQCIHWITGSAPTPADVHAWYERLGVMLRDGYGMTENFIYGCIAQGDIQVPGSVGTVFGRGEGRISEEGEILFRSGALMKGYYRDAEKTAETLRGGWLHTGDKGRIDDAGNVFVTGRIADTFKTQKGKFIDPAQIEDRCGGFTLVEQVCVLGHGLEQPVAIGVLAPDAAERP
ncbi:MAG: AMP-binding protein [Pseudomonadota bacterium]